MRIAVVNPWIVDESLKNGSTENIGFIIPVSVVQKFLTAWRRVAKAQNRQASGRTVDQDITRLFCPQDCSAGVSHNSVCVCARAPKERSAKICRKSIPQMCLPRIIVKSVLQEWHRLSWQHACPHVLLSVFIASGSVVSILFVSTNASLHLDFTYMRICCLVLFAWICTLFEAVQCWGKVIGGVVVSRWIIATPPVLQCCWRHRFYF